MHIKPGLDTFIQLGTGSVARSFPDKMRDTVSVFDSMSSAQIDDVRARAAAVDVTAAVQTAVDRLPTGNGRILFPGGRYLVTDQITIAQDCVFLEGDGKRATTIDFQPASAKSCFKFVDGAAGVLFQGGVRGMSFAGSNGVKKIAVELVDTSEMVIEDVAINPWTGAVSEAIKLRGREFTDLNRVEANADLPLHIADNPNYTIDCDYLNVNRCYFIVSDVTQPSILIDSGVNLSHVLIDGCALVKGANGIYWVDTTSTVQSIMLAIRNTAWEQPDGTAGHFVRIEHNTKLRGLVISNQTHGGGGAGIGSIKLRKVWGTSLRDVTSDSDVTVPLDMDSTCQVLSLSNVTFAGTSLPSIAGVTGIEGSYYQEGTGAMHTFAPNTPNLGGTMTQHLNPSTTLGFNQDEPLSVTVAANTVIKLASNELDGILFICALTSGVKGIIAVNGSANTTGEMSDIYSQFGVTAAGSNYNVYSSGGEYKFQNNTGSSEAFKFQFFGVGEH